jgi:O-antigen/teichoic acid export membrane protein
MGVTLYTSRVVLNVLGVQDFGIYSIVGGIVALFAFLNGAMSSATQRFLAIDIGKKDWTNLHKTFNSTLIIHIAIAFIILFVAETIGFWFLNYKLVIPDDRIYVANFVYQFSVFTSIVSITQVPFNALIVARERMNVFAIISILDVVFKLLVVVVLSFSPLDKLKTYSVLLFLVTIIVSTIYKIYCLRNFNESKFHFYSDRSLYKSLISYSGWNLIGNSAAVAKGQGINILLNLFFGTTVNAAYGIMMQVQNAVAGFVNNFQTAVNPQIYKNYAQQNYIQMHKLMFQSSKFSFFMILVLISPIIYNVKFILVFWLKNPPPYTDIFVVLTLLNLLIESISYPLITGALATGKIKNYQIVVGVVLFLNLPLSYLCFKLSATPIVFLYVAIVLSILTLCFRLLFLRKMIKLDLKDFFNTVLIPVLITSGFVIMLLSFTYYIAGISHDFGKLLVTSVVIVIFTTCFIISFGLKNSERKMLYGLIKNRIKK